MRCDPSNGHNSAPSTTEPVPATQGQKRHEDCGQGIECCRQGASALANEVQYHGNIEDSTCQDPNQEALEEINGQAAASATPIAKVKRKS